MSRFLGIDLGTSFLKGAVLNLERGTFEHVRREAVPAPIRGLPATRYELDPNALLATFRSLLSELLRHAPDANGLVACSQMHCLVFTDDRGCARSNVITWKDQRTLEPSPSGSGSLFDELKRIVTPEEQRQLGGEMRVGVPITTLHALKRRGELPSGLFAAALPDFLLANLCGVEPTTDPTNASAHGLYNVERSDWHRDLIERLGLKSLHWPRIRPFGEVVGVVEADGRQLTCFTPVGDQQCALAGLGVQEGELSVNVSTGSQASLVSTNRASSSECQVRPYFDGKWLRTIVSVPAGRSLGLLVDLLTEVGRANGQFDSDPWKYVASAVAGVPETDLEVDLSFFASLTGDRGSITNVHEGNFTVGHLFAAAFRTMAKNYARCGEILSPERQWQRVVFSGGLVQRFERLRAEILARLSNPEYRLCTSEEDTLAGLLALGRVCAGQARTVADATRQ